MSEAYNSPPKPEYEYEAEPPLSRLLPCPHRHLFGIPNGMDQKQLADHTRGCVFIDGRPYRVDRIHEETDQ